MDDWVRTILADAVLGLLAGWVLIRRRGLTVRVFALSIGALAALFVVDAILDALRLWNAYADDPVGRYYLPPHSTIVFRHIWRLAQPVLAAAAAATAVFGLPAFAKRRRRLEQYGPDDVAFLTLAAFVSGWPGFFLTFIAIFLVSAVGSIVLHIHSIRSRTHPRSRSLSFGGEYPSDQVRCSPAQKGGGSAEPQPIRLIITPFILPVTAVMLWFLPFLLHVTSLETIRF